ncbi:unnamed protein product [Brachionus calyciflorus]|uniref:UNC93-like protein n=1 Tax=Brachionus calyciflorus TaxID=104777 RepID=A0A813SIE2_9BILA|nr:unnamed protein product [Brachionus calyciflorus]
MKLESTENNDSAIENSTLEIDNDLNDVSKMTKDERKKAKRLIMKNLIVVGLSWVFLFTAYSSIANLQSSLNSEKGLGTVSLSTIYVTLVLSCIFLPTILMKKLGIKWTIFISQLAYILYIAANVFPKYYTLVPTAIILGLGAAPLWTAKCTFLTDLGTLYAKLSGETAEIVINRFFGIFFAMFQSGNIWGNIISSTVLKPIVDENSTFVSNITFCGVNDCPGSGSVEIKKPQKSTVYLLCGIYIGCALFAAFLIFTFINSYRKLGLKHSKEEQKTPVELLVNTLRHIKNKNQILIIPLTLWSGFEQAYISADFTKSFISCVKGVDFVGYIMICYGVSDTLGSYGFGYVIKYIGRIPCFLIAAAMNYATILLMIFWKPSLETSYVLFIIAIMWGLSDAVWQTQINAFYGVVFRSSEEAAFSNYRLWESLGFVIAYAYSNYLCISTKLYLLLFYLTCGIIGYGTIEIRLKSQKKAQITPF